MSKTDKHSDLRQRLIGLGERSIKKSYYPELQKRMVELERFRHVLDHASDAIFLAEATSGQIADSNATAATLTGYSKAELLNRSLFGLFTERLPLDRLGQQPFQAMLKIEGARQIPVELSLWFQSFSTADYLVCIARDISARQRAEAERERLIEELEKKNMELERFLYTASHDLKTPLTTVKGFTGLLEEDLHSGDSEAVTKDLARINDAVDHMLSLLNDVLELSRIGRIEHRHEIQDLAELAAEATRRIAPRLELTGANVNIRPGLPAVMGDRNRLLELFQNLLDNAVKFSTGKNPEVVVETQRLENGSLAVCVRDQGVGVEPRYHENIFGLFNQLDPSRTGTGVGLTIVKRVVELHGGTVWLESEGEGKGSSFCFTMQDMDG